MAIWDRNKVAPSALNGGNEYVEGDFPTEETLNAANNNAFYSVDFTEALADAPDNTEAGNIGTPTVTLIDNVKTIDGIPKTFKKFKFANLKGEKGDAGINDANVVQTFGTSTEDAISQKVITDKFDDIDDQLNSVPVSGTSYALTKSLSNTVAGIMQSLVIKGKTETVESVTSSTEKGEVTIGAGTAITRARYPKLQSVPAITDTFDVLSGVHTQNIATPYTLLAGDIIGINASLSNVDFAYTNNPIFADSYEWNNDTMGRVCIPDMAEIPMTALNLTSSIGCFRSYVSTIGGQRLIFIIAKGTSLANVRTTLAGKVIYYQLATPVLSYYPPKSIPLEVGSSIQHEPILSDIGFYSSGVAITDTDYLIDTLEEVFKVDEETGIETPIDISSCTIAVDGLSFTSTALTNGDLVWFRYQHSNDSTVPTTEYTYTTSLSGGLTTIQQDLKKQNESLQKQIDELRTVIQSLSV